ncbi:CMRF35-like molecule 1 [Ambystoma mexicanum]|uniref:CMRF35-like molecule 1 n=1 Tax=Ambystoma mexicanum TaxID=8296 RepID=UPI0037E74655
MRYETSLGSHVSEKRAVTRDSTMKAIAVWVLVHFAGVPWALGDVIEEVSGTEGGALTVHCRYSKRLIGYRQYWCRGAERQSCSVLVQSTGSQKEVKRGRLSIKDDHKARIFTVTTRGLTLGDSGLYWCGTERYGRDEMYQVRVTVSSLNSDLTHTGEPPTATPPLPAPSTTAPSTPSYPPHTEVPSTPVPTATFGLPHTVGGEMRSSSALLGSGSTDAPPVSPAPAMLLPGLVAAALVVLLLCAALGAWVILRRRRKSLGTECAQRDFGIRLSNRPPLDMTENPLYVPVWVPAAAGEAPAYSMAAPSPPSPVPEPCYEEIQELYSGANTAVNSIVGRQPITALGKGYWLCGRGQEGGFSAEMGTGDGDNELYENVNEKISHRCM